MDNDLDLTDIQGNVVKAYGHYAYLSARYLFLKINDASAARNFLLVLSGKVTSGVYADLKRYPGVEKPNVTTNIAFTFAGLRAIELPDKSLMGFPQEFAAGMKKRQAILGDDGPSSPEHWDPVWDKEVHIWISINGLTEEYVEERYEWILKTINLTGNGVELLTGHRGPDGADDLPYQSAAALLSDDHKPTGAEHFGFRDGIGDPVFKGQPNKEDRVLGRGKLNKDGSWSPLATGEFLLGHVDEAMEYAQAPMPVVLARNGTYMVYRKLHQNVGSFNRYLEEQSKTFNGSKEMLGAKFAGRWANGAPVVNAPDDAAKVLWDQDFAAATKAEQHRMMSDFTYNDDIEGAKCPLSSHLRRINPRGSLEYGKKGAFETPGALVDRRRILRRGLPYGESSEHSDDAGEHGIIFMALNAAIERQFEFVQQQWINYGNDFKEGNDKEILLGNHDAQRPGKMVIPAMPDTDTPPHFVTNIPRFVETRGGEYFFVPSITALQMIAAGIIDPT